MADPLSVNHVSSAASYLLVYGVVTAPLIYTLGVISWRISRNRRLAADAGRASLPQRGERLRLGPGVVAGTVARPKGLAVRVEIDQVGKEFRTKKSYRHTWTESARRVLAESFELRLPSGQLLPIEPDQRVFLVDKLDQMTRTSHTTRTRAAELTCGEAVYCVGEVAEGEHEQHAGAGYRGAPRRKQILRSPRGGQLLIASEPLGARYRTRVQFHARWLLAVFALLTFTHATVFLGFNLRVLRGRQVDARVTERYSYTTGTGRKKRDHYRVSAISLDGWHVLREDVALKTFKALRVGEIVPLTVVDGWPRVSALGSAPTVSGFRVTLMLILALFCAWLYAATRRRSRPWYDQQKVVDEGSGRL